MDDSSYLSMKRIAKTFPGVKALDEVSLNVGRGEILALLGENGAGKSTLMKILSGVYGYGQYDGTIEIDGKTRRYVNPSGAVSAGIAMIYQELNPLLDLSVAENMYLGMLPVKYVNSVDWKGLYAGADAVLASLGIAINSRMHMRFLGAGERQLVAIARALARDATIMVLDEPTSSLTDQEVERLFGILKKLRAAGKCIIYISHKFNEVYAISDRVSVLRDGRNAGEFVTAEVESDRIITAMIGRSLHDMFPRKAVEFGETVLEVRDYTVRHQHVDKVLLDRISLSVRKGEILGLAGLVGTGRSEFLNSLFGSHLGGHSGTVLLGGREISVADPRQAKASGFGLLTEDRRTNGMVAIMDIGENITLPSLRQIGSLFTLNRRAERSIAGRFVDSLRIRCTGPNQEVATLSGGNQQKVVISKWLNTEPEILLLDEPTRGVDVGAKVEIYQLMNALSDRGLAIIWASSELPELLGMSDRVLVLWDGGIVGEFKRGEAELGMVMSLMTGSASL
ncbi:MAG: sugar ABC transporter ATP-binding protein, partial [Planctomycetota bacterium]|nr:sugar ABC transporter ATP-binding protein [Planctomycetota bacterium]